jgi:hypothetical protein
MRFERKKLHQLAKNSGVLMTLTLAANRSGAGAHNRGQVCQSSNRELIASIKVQK